MSLIRSISAVTVFVRDMAPAVRFYEALGFERLYGGEAADFTSYRVGDGYMNLALRATHGDGASAAGAPAGHWGRTIFHVSDVDAMHAKAVAAGLEPEFAPRDATWGERYFHLRDPDGHELSFAKPLAD